MFKKSKGIIERFIWRIVINKLSTSRLISFKIRNKILRKFKIDIATNARIFPNCYFGNSNVSIGEGSFANNDCYFDDNATITIGADCAIGPQVMFCTTTHEIGKYPRSGEVLSKSILVENGCWIGARVTLLPGVHIGTGCIVAAGAVVNKDCEPNGLYAGVPAQRIKDLQ